VDHAHARSGQDATVCDRCLQPIDADMFATNVHRLQVQSSALVIYLAGSSNDQSCSQSLSQCSSSYQIDAHQRSIFGRRVNASDGGPHALTWLLALRRLSVAASALATLQHTDTGFQGCMTQSSSPETLALNSQCGIELTQLGFSVLVY